MDYEYEQRTCVVQCRVSSNELEKINERMEAVGVRNRSAFVRKMALDGFIIHLDLSDLKEVSRLVGIYGNNLNQYAKKANESGTVRQEDIDQLKTRMEEIWEALRKIYHQLAKIP